MRIGVLTALNVNRFAGDTARILGLVEGLRNHDLEVVPMIPRGGNPEIARAFAPCHFLRVPMPSRPALRYASLAVLSQYIVAAQIEHMTFDLIQFEGACALPFSGLRRMMKREKVIFDMHSIVANELEPYLPPILRYPVSVLFRQAQEFASHNAHCLVVSQGMRRVILKRTAASADKIHIVPNGVNLGLAKESMQKFRGAYAGFREQAEPLLVFVGSLEWIEGVDLIIDALAILKRNLPSAKLVIAGTGTQMQQLVLRAARLHLRQSVVFCGQIRHEDTFALQSVADILLVPARPLSVDGVEINAPLKIPAYMASGRPIVASDVGDVCRTARDMTEAVLVRDLSPQAFAQAIETLWSNKTLMEELTVNCSARAEEYSWDRVTKRLIDIYSQVMAERT